MINDIQEFKAGEIVPTSGIYDVIHDSLDGNEHAHTHQVVAIAGMTFLPCSACKNSVRFRLRSAIEHIERDPHFKSERHGKE